LAGELVDPRDRARLVGVYRFWRDFGFVLGALVAGAAADLASPRTAIGIVAALTAASGLVVAGVPFKPLTEKGDGRFPVIGVF